MPYLRLLSPVVLVVSLTFGAIGCGDSSTPTADAVPLIDHQKWAEVDSANDPFWANRPVTTPNCAPYSYSIEGFTPGTQSIEISTEACDYLTIGQPLPVAIKAGDTLDLVAWHLRMSADGATEQNPVEGMMGVAIGEHIVWKDVFDIPGPEASYTEKITVDFSAPAGTMLTFHVHNHGNNAYNLMKVDLLAAP